MTLAEVTTIMYFVDMVIREAQVAAQGHEGWRAVAAKTALEARERLLAMAQPPEGGSSTGCPTNCLADHNREKGTISFCAACFEELDQGHMMSPQIRALVLAAVEYRESDTPASWEAFAAAVEALLEVDPSWRNGQ